MSDFLSLGELLIDFTPSHLSSNDRALYERNPGGAPANVAVQTALLGLTSAFIGKVGRDNFGIFLKEVLESYSVSTKGLVLDEESLTTLAFVDLDKSGDRSFTFYRKPGADTQLEFKEVDLGLIDNCKIFHFGSLSFTDEPMKSTTLKAIDYAKSKNKIISYDPNWRPPLWKSLEEGLEGMKLGLKHTDIIKLSDEELAMITGINDIRGATDKLFDMGIKIALVTLGPKGCYVANRNNIDHLETYDVHVVDTTGSGDSFFGAFLYRLIFSSKNLEDISFKELLEFADFANAAGALCASKTGAMPALPNFEEILDCMNTLPKLKYENNI